MFYILYTRSCHHQIKCTPTFQSRPYIRNNEHHQGQSMGLDGQGTHIARIFDVGVLGFHKPCPFTSLHIAHLVLEVVEIAISRPLPNLNDDDSKKSGNW